MNAAAGDPIMMTTGHFSDYTFIVVDEVTEENSNNNNGGGKTGEVTCKTIKEWDTIYGDKEDADYDDKENESIYCQKTGEMLVYCLYGDFNGAYSNLYSIKVDGKEFKCESENKEDCIFKMEQYCEALDGEYEDGYYCEEQGECKETGEMVKSCVLVQDYENIFYQVGDKKFECTRDNIEECYTEVYEYCGSIDEYVDEIDEDPVEDPGLICRTETEWATEYSDEEHHVWICETTGLEITICIPDTFDMEDMEEGEFPPFYSIETGGARFYCDPSTAYTEGTIGDYATSMDCYKEAEDYCTPQ